MLNDSDLATLRNRFKKDAEFFMQTTTSPDEDEKSKLLNVSCLPALLAKLNQFSDRTNANVVTAGVNKHKHCI